MNLEEEWAGCALLVNAINALSGQQLINKNVFNMDSQIL